MTTAYRFMHRHTRNTLVARGGARTLAIANTRKYSRCVGLAVFGHLGGVHKFAPRINKKKPAPKTTCLYSAFVFRI
ncbi:hypothetical protein [Enterobacter hormaechei]